MPVDPTAALLAGAIAVAGLVTCPIERRLFRSDLSTGPKLAAYASLMLLLWGLTAAALGLSGWTALREPPAAPSPWLSVGGPLGAALVVLVAAYFVLALLPLLQSLRGQRFRLAYAAAMRRQGSDLRGMLPNTALECAGFALVSLTAGFCEEVLFRGYLFRFAHNALPHLPVAAVLTATSAAFGLGHAYQGVRGVLTTAVAGLALGLVFLLTRDLVPCIVLHALIDLQVAYVLRPGAPSAGASATPAAA